MSAMFYTGDSLENFVTMIGTAKDPRMANKFRMETLTQADLENAYRSDWMSRKICDIPADDATREWRAWKADKAAIEKIEEIEKRFGIQKKVALGMARGNLYGGAALVIGLDDDPAKMLEVENVGVDALKFVHLAHRYELSAGPVNWDALDPWFGWPLYYTFSAASMGSIGAGAARAGLTSGIRLHPSRIIRFTGKDIPDPRMATDGWGDSVLQIVYAQVRDTASTNSIVASLLNDSKVDVVKIPGYTDMVKKNTSKEKLIDRFSFANVAKSSVNALLLDKEEEWTRMETNLSGYPEVMQQMIQLVSGAADIPVTRFLGQTPSGLSSTGESDLRNYYDRVSADQRNRLTPSLRQLDEVMLRSALGTRDPKIHFSWNPLWQTSAKEQGEVRNQQATAVKSYLDTGTVPPEVMAVIVRNIMVEDGGFPGAEQAFADFDAGLLEPLDMGAEEVDEEGNPIDEDGNPIDLDEEDMDAKEKESGERAAEDDGKVVPFRKKKKAFGDSAADTARRIAEAVRSNSIRFADARPKSLYMRRDLLNRDELVEHYTAQGLSTVLVDPHVTVVYSRASIDWMQMGEMWEPQDGKEDRVIVSGGPRMHEVFGHPGSGAACLALLFASSRIQWRHEEAVRKGATHDYPEYVPHVTITYDLPPDVESVEPYKGSLVFGPEIFEEVKVGKHVPVEDRGLTVDRSFRQSTMVAVRHRDSAARAPAPVEAQVADAVSLARAITDALRSAPIQVTMPRKGREVTTVTKHDAEGRILEFERKEIPDGET